MYRSTWRRLRGARNLAGLTLGLGLGLIQGLAWASPNSIVVDTPEQARDAFSALSDAQQAELAQLLSGLLGRVDFSAAVNHFLPELDASGISNGTLSGLLGSSSASLAGLNLSLPAEVLNLLPSALRYHWEVESGGQTQRIEGLLNVPTLIDADGDSVPDFNASLSISGTSSVTLQVERLAAAVLGGNDIAMKIEAVVKDPRAGATSAFALGYDALHSKAPDSFTEVISIGGVLNSTQISVDVSISGAGATLDLLAEQFSPNGTARDPQQTIALGLTPVPSTAHVSVSQASNDISVAVGAASRSLAEIDFVDYKGGQAHPVHAIIDRLPTSMNLSFREVGGDRILSYSASQSVDAISADASNLSGFGRANRLELLLAGIPTALSLNMGNAGDFDLDAGNADLGLVEFLLSNGPNASLPTGHDGVLMTETPSTSILAGRISQLRRISGSQSPLSLYLDSLAGNPMYVELRDKPSSNAKETYTRATLNNLQRQTQISISDGSKQQIHYSAAAATSSLSFETNAGSRDKLTASASPIASQISICAAGNNSCSTSGKAGNTGSFRITASSPMTLNLRDCNNASCSGELRISNFRIRHVDMAINVGKNCTFWGSCVEGSKGSIWLDTDNHEMRGSVISRDGLPIKAYFGPGFRSNNRYVSWNWFVPSKSGSISCGSGSYLDVTVFGITLDIIDLYLC